MARTYAYSADFDKDIESLFKDAKLLGEGHNGIVYEVPGNRAIKIFTDKNVCKSEAEILYRVKKSKYFPRIYKNGDYYILRDMVNGIRLDDYIKKQSLLFPDRGISRLCALSIRLVAQYHLQFYHIEHEFLFTFWTV